ncbi:MAG: hypothetical protein JO021_04220 [Alphaproteobacteria bacterium]|nr:hypothetical protein [Alphaproteobacteria bacterium]
MSDASQRWRDKAKAYRTLAAVTRVAREQAEFADLAVTYERLADDIDRGLNPRLLPERIVRHQRSGPR